MVPVFGYLTGCKTIDDIADFAELRAAGFADLMDMDSVPSYDTLWWFLTRINPDAFKALLVKWFQLLDIEVRDKLLVIDGKRLRRVSDSDHITHIVELFASEKTGNCSGKSARQNKRTTSLAG